MSTIRCDTQRHTADLQIHHLIQNLFCPPQIETEIFYFVSFPIWTLIDDSMLSWPCAEMDTF